MSYVSVPVDWNEPSWSLIPPFVQRIKSSICPWMAIHTSHTLELTAWFLLSLIFIIVNIVLACTWNHSCSWHVIIISVTLVRQCLSAVWITKEGVGVQPKSLSFTGGIRCSFEWGFWLGHYNESKHVIIWWMWRLKFNTEGWRLIPTSNHSA